MCGEVLFLNCKIEIFWSHNHSYQYIVLRRGLILLRRRCEEATPCLSTIVTTVMSISRMTLPL